MLTSEPGGGGVPRPDTYTAEWAARLRLGRLGAPPAPRSSGEFGLDDVSNDPSLDGREDAIFGGLGPRMGQAGQPGRHSLDSSLVAAQKGLSASHGTGSCRGGSDAGEGWLEPSFGLGRMVERGRSSVSDDVS